jgi:anthranilate phosphoribosyltransferase
LTPESLSPEQLAGAVDAVMTRALPFTAFPDAVDCCGTGGDGQHTLNISTAVAFVVAGCGVTVAKHGNRAVTSKSGSADVLEVLGVNTQITAERAARILDEVGICFLFAPSFHPGFKNIAAARKAIGTRTIFNLLGPLCNPAHVKRQLIGVYSAEVGQLVAETCKLLERTHVMVAHGKDGSDEFSISGDTLVWELVNGTVTHHTLNAADAGLESHARANLKGGTATENGTALREILMGEENTYADAVILNAAACLMVAGQANDLTSAALLAREALKDGRAHAKLDALITASNA